MHEKKGIFCCTESTAMTPKSRDHMPLGSRCKMANSSSEDETNTLPERPTRIQPYQFEPVKVSGRILKEYRNIVSALKQTPIGIPWGLQNRTH